MASSTRSSARPPRPKPPTAPKPLSRTAPRTPRRPRRPTARTTRSSGLLDRQDFAVLPQVDDEAQALLTARVHGVIDQGRSRWRVVRPNARQLRDRPATRAALQLLRELLRRHPLLERGIHTLVGLLLGARARQRGHD